MAGEFGLKPTSRGEEFLDVILRSLGGDTPDIPQPAWRYEEYLAAIANAVQNGGGSSGGVLVVHDVDGTLDKTWQEIHDAMAAGQVPVVGYADGTDAGITIIVWGAFLDETYSLWDVSSNPSQDDPLYSASSASGYPTAN